MLGGIYNHLSRLKIEMSTITSPEDTWDTSAMEKIDLYDGPFAPINPWLKNNGVPGNISRQSTQVDCL